MPDSHDLDVYLGDTRDLLVTWKHNGVLQPLADWTLAAQIRQDKSSDEILATLTVTPIGDGSTGQMLVVLPPEEQALLTVGRASAVWDLQATHLDGTVRTILAGKVNVSRDVTRPV